MSRIAFARAGCQLGRRDRGALERDSRTNRCSGLGLIRLEASCTWFACDNAPMTQAARNPVKTVREIADRAIRLAKLELELKTVGWRGKAARVGAGAGFGLLALLLMPLVVVFALATVAAALATMMHVWLAILIVTGILVVMILTLAGMAVWLIRGAVKGGDDGER